MIVGSISVQVSSTPVWCNCSVYLNGHWLAAFFKLLAKAKAPYNFHRVLAKTKSLNDRINLSVGFFNAAILQVSLGGARPAIGYWISLRL